MQRGKQKGCSKRGCAECGEDEIDARKVQSGEAHTKMRVCETKKTVKENGPIYSFMSSENS